MILPIVTTHYSLLKGFIKPKEVAKKCKEYGYTHCLIADIDTISGVIDFFSEMKKAGITPIIGMKENDGYYIAKSMSGYKKLIRLASGHDVIFADEELQFYGRNELAGFNAFYADKDDAVLHQIAICSGFKTTLKKSKNIDLGDYRIFFNSDDFYFKNKNEVTATDIQIKNTEKLISELKDYTILSQPKLPKVDCGDMNENDYLTQLCRDGWRSKLSHLKGDIKKEYVDRIKYELSIIHGFNLSGYFLIVEDIVRYVRSNGWMPGPGRGSAGGCLLSYLLSITEIDPIPYDLLFSRFLNSGRFSKDNISLPDIDIDVPTKYRDQIIEYLKDKYGHDKVCQMITLGRLQGRAALKEVLRICSDLSQAEMNEITKALPQESAISDDLEEMEIKSVILWGLENTPKKLEKWCKLDEENNLVGELSDLFSLAIRIEGTYKSQGKHPAGVVISNQDLIEDAPLIKDSNGDRVVGFEMSDLDKAGLTKFDILGINLLDKVMEITQ